MSSFDDRDFETLQEEMLDEVEDDFDTEEGSYIATGIAKNAVRFEDAYADLGNVEDNMYLDTMDEEHLMEHGEESGIAYNYGTEAVIRVRVNCECEDGDEFTAVDADHNYTIVVVEDPVVIDDVTWYVYQMEADEEGVDPGTYRGDLEPVDMIDGFETAVIMETMTAGTEDEDPEDYRMRAIEALRRTPCAGNNDYYYETVMGIAGVGGVKCKRRDTTSSYISIYIQNATDYGAPSEDLITSVAQALNPTGYEGEGVGYAPFGELTQVFGVTEVLCNITAEFTFQEGYTFEGLQAAISDAIANYLLELRQGWADGKVWRDSAGLMIYIARIENAILSVEGLLDVTGTAINGSTDSVQVEIDEVPVMGTLSER